MSEPFTASRGKSLAQHMYKSPTKRTSDWTSWKNNAVRQIKLILPGAMITYYLGTIEKLVVVVQSKHSIQSKFALAALGSALAMIVLFFYILLLIYRRSKYPNWRTWRQTGSLSIIIPILTATIMLGWLLHVIVLGKWTELGYLRGFLGASGLYALVFGVLALIPAPRKCQET